MQAASISISSGRPTWRVSTRPSSQSTHHNKVLEVQRLSLQLKWDNLAATEWLATTQGKLMTSHGRLLVEQYTTNALLCQLVGQQLAPKHSILGPCGPKAPPLCINMCCLADSMHGSHDHLLAPAPGASFLSAPGGLHLWSNTSSFGGLLWHS